MGLHLTQDIRNGADVAVLDSFRGLTLPAGLPGSHEPGCSPCTCISFSLSGSERLQEPCDMESNIGNHVDVVWPKEVWSASCWSLSVCPLTPSTQHLTLSDTRGWVLLAHHGSGQCRAETYQSSRLPLLDKEALR